MPITKLPNHNINHMIDSKHLAIVNVFAPLKKFTKARFDCTKFWSQNQSDWTLLRFVQIFVLFSEKLGQSHIFNPLNVLLFQCWWAWEFPGDATHNFICDSNTAIFRLSNDVSFIPEAYLKHGQKSQNIKLVQ